MPTIAWHVMEQTEKVFGSGRPLPNLVGFPFPTSCLLFMFAPLTSLRFDSLAS